MHILDQPDDELAGRDLVELNLLVAKSIPALADLDIPKCQIPRMASLNRPTRSVSKSGKSGPAIRTGIHIASFRSSAGRPHSHLLDAAPTPRPAQGSVAG